MNDPVLGEVIIITTNTVPTGYVVCDGRELPINQHPELYALLGTTYGGDGQTVFALPNLNGRVPIAPNSSFPRGTSGGEETHALTIAEMPSHTHTLFASSTEANSVDPTNNLIAPTQLDNGMVFSAPSAAPDVVLNSGSVETSGSGAGHNNMQPTLVINFCIAITGTTPPPQS